MLLHVSTNYKSYVRVGIKLQEMTKVRCLIDTGAGPKLVTKLFLQPCWTSHIRAQNVLKHWSANKRPINSEEVDLLHLQIGGTCIRLWFGVVGNVAVDLLLETALMDKYIEGSFLAESNLVF